MVVQFYECLSYEVLSSTLEDLMLKLGENT